MLDHDGVCNQIADPLALFVGQDGIDGREGAEQVDGVHAEQQFSKQCPGLAARSQSGSDDAQATEPLAHKGTRPTFNQKRDDKHADGPCDGKQEPDDRFHRMV